VRGLSKLTIVQAKLFLREPAAFFFTLVFPVLLLLLFGAIFGNAPDPAFNPDYGYIDTEVPALAAIIIGSVALMGIPVATASAREHKVLRRYRVTPMPPTLYVTADVVINYFMALVGMVILIIVARLVFELRFGGTWFNVLAGFTLSALAFFAVGYLIASLAPTARIAQTVGMVLFFPMMFLSGAAFPREIMPESIQRLSNLLPLTYVVELLQGLWFGGHWGDYLLEVGVLLGMLVVGAVVSTQTFRWE